ncbi:RNA-binding domain-containing protein [Metschnikowia bicuspidata var. bicuspidata NRRL YB-4993]|uniref:RNA-binding domain-containing protein n=1 Tax=Metschnikowia bicuspidata var. bicuspidata NRRL YB-4993 TaxID=869754 RepID=A0A1A0H8X4_9ASCO|nr:RNA-binding domain-containing protein [Metschnikowia bicuspidata var. bicuspidata NRRL YB-4993]OBA20461.1 RNA-binding domain-containing protein [Metschnikowia bicuspidata var. bicuspidata NRRL YB-4993]
MLDQTSGLRNQETSSSAPSGTTLYINNINEKIALNKIKFVLAKLFGRYGTVVGITAHTNLRMKGQAFVTYKEPQSCEKAILKLQGRPMFKKPLHVSFAQKPSDQERSLKGDSEGILRRKQLKKVKAEADEKARAEAPAALLAPTQISKAQEKQWKLLLPNNVLLLQNVDENKLELALLEEKFGAFAGFAKIRLIKFRKLAFVDFDLEPAATACLENIDHGQFGNLALLSYAKK